jgi:hypothetical protein
MEFRLDECAKIVLNEGKLFHSQNLILDITREMQELEQAKPYRYVGTEDSGGIQHQPMKESLKKEYTRIIKNDTEIQVECQE